MPKHLVIVESPTKAKTITKFLGKDYTVLSSFGHIRDLPSNKTGVDVENDFKPTYVIPDKSKKAVAELKKAAGQAEDIILATDEDREGEAIAWHIAQILGLDEATAKRITFHEITSSAIARALEHPRTINEKLVDAQQTRRILDRLVGYELSPFLWQKVRRGLSAGRVQSVAMRLIVERERERQAFKVDEYWTIDGVFNKDETPFPGTLTKIGDRKLEKLDLKTEADAKKIVDDLQGATVTVGHVEKKEVSKAPPTPFTTSTLQMEANSKLGFSAKQTMTLAQKLYETGRITYMRTDSTNLSEQFLNDAQSYIASEFGAAYATGAKTYKTAKQGAQEAHEAIRPTDVKHAPGEFKGKIDAGMWKLYDLIWRRSVATQLPPAKLERTAVDLSAKDYTFRANGSTILFDGYMKVYRSAQEKLLPKLAQGDAVAITSITPTQHFTEPPPRYSDATLVKILEEHGIGRPSTYAPTISTIIDRGYVERDDNKKLFPTETAFIVNDVLVEHFPTIVDYDFTATMERHLDDIAEGQKDWVTTLRDFYGPFHTTIKEKQTTLTREDIMKERVLGVDPASGKEVIALSGRFGPYVQIGRKEKGSKEKLKSASLMKGMVLDTITLEDALSLLVLPRVVGQTEDGVDIVANNGRFGPYLKADTLTASLPPEVDPRFVTLEDARRLLKEGAERKKQQMAPIADLGEDPKTKAKVLVKNGRFGPYITDGTTNVSVSKKIDPTTVTLEMALEMLEKKRTSPPRRFGKKTGNKKEDA